MSSKRTTSPASRDNVSWTMAIERMRRSDSSIAACASGDSQPTALQPEQRGDGLQVVLHPVVDLPDGGVLREQEPVATTEVGDVAQQQQDPDDVIAFELRDGLQQQ